MKNKNLLYNPVLWMIVAILLVVLSSIGLAYLVGNDNFNETPTSKNSFSDSSSLSSNSSSIMSSQSVSSVSQSMNSSSKSSISSSNANTETISEENTNTEKSEFEIKAGLSTPLNKNLILESLGGGWNGVDLEKYTLSECDPFDPSRSDQFEFFNIKENINDEPEAGIAKINCFNGAYNFASKMVFYPKGLGFPENRQIMDVYSYIDEEYVISDSSDPTNRNVLVNVFNYDYLTFESLALSRGVGDCGIYYKYQIVPEKAAIYPIEERDQECLDDTSQAKTYESWEVKYKVEL